eukprot:11171367-Lingulodinium_polyedra.AAC.1
MSCWFCERIWVEIAHDEGRNRQQFQIKLAKDKDEINKFLDARDKFIEKFKGRVQMKEKRQGPPPSVLSEGLLQFAAFVRAGVDRVVTAVRPAVSGSACVFCHVLPRRHQVRGSAPAALRRCVIDPAAGQVLAGVLGVIVPGDDGEGVWALERRMGA